MRDLSRKPFKARRLADEPRPGDVRSEYERDEARIVHGAGFRRLQGKTQVLAVAEGDFHRTRLTHSIEVAQIGCGILAVLKRRHAGDEIAMRWLPRRGSVASACHAHDLGHPPFGHGGEAALQECMASHGGFEGNAQTLRMMVRLERHHADGGLNPTRRTLLGVLKYPMSYADYDPCRYALKPPKCFYADEQDWVDWALEPFSGADRALLTVRRADDVPAHRCLDASLMECADDVAYAVHDLEDAISTRIVRRDDVEDRLVRLMPGGSVGPDDSAIGTEDLLDGLFGASGARKRLVGSLVHLFVTQARLTRIDGFAHPLLRRRVGFEPPIAAFLDGLKAITMDLVVDQAGVRHLERRGRRIVKALFGELVADPGRLIPREAWEGRDRSASNERCVCDHIAGMTDAYAERVYGRLFVPVRGSGRDEL